MNGSEYLVSKGLLKEGTRLIISNEGVDVNLADLLDEFALLSGVTTIKLDRPFPNRPEQDYKGEQVRTFDGEQAKDNE